MPTSDQNRYAAEHHIDLERVTPALIGAAAQRLQSLAAGAGSREEAADRIVEEIFETFRSSRFDGPACALVRCFQTCPLSALPPARRGFAVQRLGSAPSRGNLRCLTLLGTRGLEARWNSVDGSAEHQAIPLPTVDVILRAPMIARLLLQMGIRFEHVVEPPADRPGFLIEDAVDNFNIFHVEKALGSPYIPAQASFVHRYNVRSVLGFGGFLPGGELFAVVLFSRVTVSKDTAELFRALARSAKAALVPFATDRIFLQ